MAVKLWEEGIIAVIVTVKAFIAFICVVLVLWVYQGAYEQKQHEEVRRKPKESQEKVGPVLQRLLDFLAPELEDVVVLLEKGPESWHLQTRVLSNEFIRPHFVF